MTGLYTVDKLLDRHIFPPINGSNGYYFNMGSNNKKENRLCVN